MNVQETTNLLIRFTADVSPWWLALVLPLACALVWLLYRLELRQMDRRHRGPLLGLRLALAVLIVLMIFRPDLVHERTLTYPGRTMFVVDDSPSMAARDNRMTDAQALHTARTLDGQTQDDTAPLFALIHQVYAVQRELGDYERFSRGAERSRDEFWQTAAAYQDRIGEHLAACEEYLAIGRAMFGAPVPADMAKIDRQLASLAAELPAYFSGSQTPAHAAFVRAAAQGDRIIALARQMQGELDERAIAAGDEQLADRAQAIRRTPRVELLSRQLANIEIQTGYQAVSLITGQALDWPSDAAPLVTRAGVTDLVGRMQQLADEPSDFPLSAIVLLSDGRDVVGRPASALEQTLTRSQSPVMAAGVGDTIEPVDLALVELIAPPIAVANQPFSLMIRLKPALPQATETQLQITRGEEVVHSEKIKLTPGAQQDLTVRFTPTQLGIARYRLTLEPVPGEVLPVANNAADFVLNTRPRKVSVLLVDYRPRWQTRFVLNILRRLPYVQLNPIIVTTQQEGELRRGVELGAWPDSAAALDMYDLVFIGELPDDLLTDQEQRALTEWVEEKGRTLVRLGRRDADPIERFDNLVLAPAGLSHPMTLDLAGQLPVAEHDDAAVLLVDAAGGALLTADFRAAGREVVLHTDRLWKALNRGHLAAHARMVVEMVTWGLEAERIAADEQENAPFIALDRRRLIAGEPLGVRANVPDGTTVRLTDGEQVDRTQTTAGGAAVFAAAPPGDLRVELEGTELVSPSVFSVTDDDELDRLALDVERLSLLAQRTGGAYRALTELEQLLALREPTERVEQNERVWRLWDAPLLMGLLIVLLTVEWVYRKLVGLV